MIADNRLAIKFAQQSNCRLEGIVVTGDITGTNDIVDLLSAKNFQGLAQWLGTGVNIANEAEAGSHFARGS